MIINHAYLIHSFFFFLSEGLLYSAIEQSEATKALYPMKRAKGEMADKIHNVGINFT
jgi:hypothetical protein